MSSTSGKGTDLLCQQLPSVQLRVTATGDAPEKAGIALQSLVVGAIMSHLLLWQRRPRGGAGDDGEAYDVDVLREEGGRGTLCVDFTTDKWFGVEPV